MKIKYISSEDTFSIRHPMLRKGRPLISCHFDGDDEPNTIHLGAFINDQLSGILSCYKRKSKYSSLDNQFQIRGVAVLKSYQKKGVGKALMLHAEKILINKNCNLIWLNARVNALPFYTQLNYEKSGSVFDVEHIGLHQCFIKKTKKIV